MNFELRRGYGLPLAWQIMALLLGGLVVAQGVTLALTELLPPAAAPQYDLNDVAAALAAAPGRAAPGRALPSLQRKLQAGPPVGHGPGWVTSERSRHDLARMLHRDESDVRLFYDTPLPFAGTAAPTAPRAPDRLAPPPDRGPALSNPAAPPGRGTAPPDFSAPPPGRIGPPDGLAPPLNRIGPPDGGWPPSEPPPAEDVRRPGLDAATSNVQRELPPRRSFGFGPPPVVEGDFIAAVRLDAGHWAVVQPTPEAFPNAWQRRVLLWFALAAALVAPLGWLFSRRLVRPLAAFAQAAERLGRDPAAPVRMQSGPAEIGRAAAAFNRMQSRLRSVVDDRTAMIGAISHDLRTPLTRLRFRIEDAPDALQPGMRREVDEMEQMIASVLAFIRDASEPGARETLDLASLVEDVVEDATFVGHKVVLLQNDSAPVEVDAIGVRRLLGNLIENAAKYGGRARVELRVERLDAVVDIGDDGPGLPDAELDKVFAPFYRTPAARASGTSGSGLGLAVCRSIARAHGGDVQLRRGTTGLVAQVRLPLA